MHVAGVVVNDVIVVSRVAGVGIGFDVAVVVVVVDVVVVDVVCC